MPGGSLRIKHIVIFTLGVLVIYWIWRSKSVPASQVETGNIAEVDEFLLRNSVLLRNDEADKEAIVDEALKLVGQHSYDKEAIEQYNNALKSILTNGLKYTLDIERRRTNQMIFEGTRNKNEELLRTAMKQRAILDAFVNVAVDRRQDVNVNVELNEVEVAGTEPVVIVENTEA